VPGPDRLDADFSIPSNPVMVEVVIYNEDGSVMPFGTFEQRRPGEGVPGQDEFDNGVTVELLED
jgi:hypothetical protein